MVALGRGDTGGWLAVRRVPPEGLHGVRRVATGKTRAQSLDVMDFVSNLAPVLVAGGTARPQGHSCYQGSCRDEAQILLS